MASLTVVDFLIANPEYALLLGVLLRAGRAYQTSLSWPEYRMVHRLKRGILPLIAGAVGGRVPLVTDKAGRDDREFVGTVPAGLRETVRDLQRSGASLHLLCALKRRPPEYGDPLSEAHLIWTVGEEQVECYLFDNSDGTTDVYCQTETSVDDPVGHLLDGVSAGDQHDVVPELAR